MSQITNIILITAAHDEGFKELYNISMEYDLVQVDEYCGGTKMMECDVYMAAINLLDVDEFLKWFNSIVFEYPESVLLLVMKHNENVFRGYYASN